MTRMVDCVKLGKQAEGLDRQTWPGDLGKRVFEQVSKEAWKLWMDHQTILINENRLNPLDPKTKGFIEEQMEAFFFGDGGAMPIQFTPPES